jgi:hypothetical protein
MWPEYLRSTLINPPSIALVLIETSGSLLDHSLIMQISASHRSAESQHIRILVLMFVNLDFSILRCPYYFSTWVRAMLQLVGAMVASIMR